MSYPCHYTNLRPHKPHKHAHSLTHPHTHTLSHTHTHSLSHTHPHTLSHTHHTHTHTHSLTHTHTLSHTHTHNIVIKFHNATVLNVILNTVMRSIKDFFQKHKIKKISQPKVSMKAFILRKHLRELENSLHASNTNVTLEHKSSHKQHSYICSNRQQYIVWVKIIDFSFMTKIIRY